METGDVRFMLRGADEISRERRISAPDRSIGCVSGVSLDSIPIELSFFEIGILKV